MSKPPDFDLNAAHRWFAADCFNRAWDFIEKPRRSPEEDEEMLRLSLASLWHWTQWPEATPQNLSVGCWQVSRVYALRGEAADARRYGLLSQQHAQAEGVGPFHRGYACEALARAAAADGDFARARAYLAEALRYAQEVADPEDRALLLKDLETIRV